MTWCSFYTFQHHYNHHVFVGDQFPVSQLKLIHDTAGSRTSNITQIVQHISWTADCCSSVFLTFSESVFCYFMYNRELCFPSLCLCCLPWIGHCCIRWIQPTVYGTLAPYTAIFSFYWYCVTWFLNVQKTISADGQCRDYYRISWPL